MHGVIIFDKVQPIKYCLNYNDIDIPFTLNDYEELLEKKRNYKHDKYSNVFEGNPNKYLDVWYRRADELFVNAISYARTYDRDNFRDPLRFFRPYRIPFHCRYYD